MNMFRKSAAAAIAIAVLSGSALVSTTVSSQAGNKHHQRHHNNHNNHNNYNYNYDYSYYQPHCFWKKVKVWDYHGYHWEKVQVCR